MESVDTPVACAITLLPPSLSNWAVPVVDLATFLRCSPSDLDRDTLILSINDVLSCSAFAHVAALENGHISHFPPRSLWLRLTYCRHLFVDETPYL